MLTLEEIENISFRKAGIGGYKTDDVDTFVDGVIIKVKDLEIANKELENRIEKLNAQIQKFKEKEESIQDAIITAEMTAKSLVREATHKAEILVTDANTKAENIVKEASEKAEKTLSESNEKAETVINNAMLQSAKKVDENNRIIEHQKKLIIQIQSEVTKFKEALIQSYRSHLEIINSLPKADEFKQYQKKLNECYPTSNTEESFQNSIPDIKKEKTVQSAESDNTVPEKSEKEKSDISANVKNSVIEEKKEETKKDEDEEIIFSSSKAEHEFKNIDSESDSEAEDMPVENKREPITFDKASDKKSDIKFGVLKLEDIDSDNDSVKKDKK